VRGWGRVGRGVLLRLLRRDRIGALSLVVAGLFVSRLFSESEISIGFDSDSQGTKKSVFCN
jgi:hypothetical protein